MFVAVGFMGFFAASMLAIDVGMLMTARSQAQNSADAGALAGACELRPAMSLRASGGSSIARAPFADPAPGV